jgi:cyclase
MLPRVIPCLLLSGGGLVKTVRFKNPTYLGDPINIVRIFNDKEVDELILLDITATSENRPPNYKLLEQVASECFMPLCYGGGIRTLEDIRRLFEIGMEKVCINTRAAQSPAFVGEAAEIFGNQSIVVSMDIGKNVLGKYKVFSHGGRKNTGLDPVAYAVQAASAGAGEILANAIDRDGMMNGYDLALLKRITASVSVPVIACGGAGSLSDFRAALENAHVSAVGAGSFFVFKGKHRAVLINYPSRAALKESLGENERRSLIQRVGQ